MLINNDPSICVQSEIATAVQLWNRAAISLLDIRHNLISPDQPIRSYHLPASAFIFTSGGKADVMLNDTVYNAERFGLFHGGKGTELTIDPQCDWLETYMVLYKAGEPAFRRKEYAKLLEHSNPFRQQYGFTPGNPLLFAQQLRSMYEKWCAGGALNLFYGKAMLYPLIYEIYAELDRGSIHVLEPDVVAMVQRYMNQHYSQSISIQDVRESFGISNSHFHRLFTARTGQSPQEYLLSQRLSAAKQYLVQTDCTLREIAFKCGFSDELSLMRMFRKHVHMTAREYRDITPYYMGDQCIDNTLPFFYNKQGRVSLDQLKERGANTMLKQMGNKAVVAAALSLVLLLSACSAAPVQTNASQPTPTPAVTIQAPQETKEAEPVEQTTRTVSTVMGDVEVPATPQRVIVDGSLRGDVLALGVIPVATQNFYNTGVAYEDLTKDTVVLEKWEPEYLMAQNPDLIITIYENDFKNFSGIAPTVVVSESELSMVERVTLIAQVLGKDVIEATKLIDTYNQKVADAKKLLEEKGLYNYTFSVVRTGGDNQIDVRWGNNLGGQFLFGEFGLPLPEAALAEIGKGETVGDAFSFEALPAYMGDYILVNESSENDYKTLSENPIWQSIPAVKENHVFVIPASFLYFGDVYSKSAQLDLIMEKLLEVAPQ